VYFNKILHHWCDSKELVVHVIALGALGIGLVGSVFGSLGGNVIAVIHEGKLGQLVGLLHHENLDRAPSHTPESACAHLPNTCDLGDDLDRRTTRDIIDANRGLVGVKDLDIGLVTQHRNLGLEHGGILARWVNLSELAVGVLEEFAALLLAEPSDGVCVSSVNQVLVEGVHLVKDGLDILVLIKPAERQVGAVRSRLVLRLLAVAGETEWQVHGRELQGDLGLGTVLVGQRDELAAHLVLLNGAEVDGGGLEGLSGVNGSHCK
jgi:hypothetical protein